MLYTIKHKIKVWRGQRYYRQATNGGKQAIPQSVIETWTDYRLKCVLDYITFTPELNPITDSILFDTIKNLLAVWSIRHPLDPEYLEASFQRGWVHIQQLINKERES